VSSGITEIDTSMYYKAEGVPWHGLGTALEDTVPALEAHIASGTDWLVEKWPIRVHGPAGQVLDAENQFATVRVNKDGTAYPLGYVTGAYRPIQQEEDCQFMDALAREGGLRIHTGGSLKGGRVVWFMGRYPKQMEIVPDDLVDCNLFICNSHDGTMFLSVGATTVRIVCMNTLMGGVADAKKRGRFMSIRHTGDMKTKLYEAQRVLGLSEKAFQQQELLMRELVDVPMSDERIEEAIEALVPDPSDEKDPSRARSLREQILEVYKTSASLDIPGVRGTGYGFLNAVTEFSDHNRGRTVSTDKRIFSAWFGRGADLKEEAVQAVVTITGAKLSGYSVASV